MVEKLNRKPVPVKWVFKIKTEQDGTYRYKSRVVIKGYLQIPGVDYSESFSPVATDTTIRLSIALSLFHNWACEMLDVEAAFLSATMDKDMFIEWPPSAVELGLLSAEEETKYCIRLNKSMYGSVDAARKFNRDLIQTLTKKMKATQSQVDPCLFFMKRGGLTCLLIVVYVDDIIVMGDQHDVNTFKKEFKRHYNITESGRLKKHLGVWYHWGEDEMGKYVRATMDDYATSIVNDYEYHTRHSAKVAATPGFPGSTLTKSSETEEIVEIEAYRSLVGKIIYYANKVSPDCMNASRELAQHMSHPNNEHWRAMERLVGHIKQKDLHGFFYRTPRELRVIGYADSNYATNPDDRKSITGLLLTIGGALLCWVSKKQQIVSLSSTEAEYIAAASYAQESKFITMLLDEVDHADSPGVMFEDNQGCIYLIHNQQVSARTKHISVKAHFVRQEQQENRLIIRYIRSERNYADPMTKNVTEKINKDLMSDILNGTPDCWREDVGNIGSSVTNLKASQVSNLIVSSILDPAAQARMDIQAGLSRDRISLTGTLTNDKGVRGIPKIG